MQDYTKRVLKIRDKYVDWFGRPITKAQFDAARSGEEAQAEEIDATDSARELAEENGLDLATIEGTGADGRIVLADVQNALKE